MASDEFAIGGHLCDDDADSLLSVWGHFRGHVFDVLQVWLVCGFFNPGRRSYVP